MQMTAILSQQIVAYLQKTNKKEKMRCLHPGQDSLQTDSTAKITAFFYGIQYNTTHTLLHKKQW